MPACLIKIDLSHLDRDLRKMQHRRPNTYSVFCLDGEFMRVATDGRKGLNLHKDRPEDLVGVYAWTAPIEIIKQDILHEVAQRSEWDTGTSAAKAGKNRGNVG